MLTFPVSVALRSVSVCALTATVETVVTTSPDVPRPPHVVCPDDGSFDVAYCTAARSRALAWKLRLAAIVPSLTTTRCMPSSTIVDSVDNRCCATRSRARGSTTDSSVWASNAPSAAPKSASHAGAGAASSSLGRTAGARRYSPPSCISVTSCGYCSTSHARACPSVTFSCANWSSGLATAPTRSAKLSTCLIELSTIASYVPCTRLATKVGKSIASASAAARRPMASVAFSLGGADAPGPPAGAACGNAPSCLAGSPDPELSTISRPNASRASATAGVIAPRGGGGGMWRAIARVPRGQAGCSSRAAGCVPLDGSGGAPSAPCTVWKRPSPFSVTSVTPT
ncbi:hypothetical protein BamIOP4010DRAFT_6530 [Burkholderia ambifaria IOP40-10]|uniref:Secreted protein n=1 Tax=Burkholderia ambifaria IOP40-10 TaxID=396596 RepID=B1FR69_9BURK|nr:hypothetical protein BamIOP4010DRAFT_6530 [Burkholderia ambifaria IOP40-10]